MFDDLRLVWRAMRAFRISLQRNCLLTSCAVPLRHLGTGVVMVAMRCNPLLMEALQGHKVDFLPIERRQGWVLHHSSVFVNIRHRLSLLVDVLWQDLRGCLEGSVCGNTEMLGYTKSSRNARLASIGHEGGFSAQSAVMLWLLENEVSLVELHFEDRDWQGFVLAAC